MKRISICGVDGSGKSTLLQEIAKLAAGVRGRVAVLRALRYSTGADLDVNRFSDKVGDMGVQADDDGQPTVKACALFLAMTLYGAAESELCEKTGCQVLFRERDPIADSIAYGKIYVELLNAPFSDALVAKYGDAEYDGYLRELLARERLGFERLPFSALPMYVRAVFSTPFPELISVLERLYRSTPADVILFLRLSPEMMRTRMERKAADIGGRTLEYHEKHETLLRLQAGLEQAMRAVQDRRGFELVTVDAVDRPAGDLAREIFQRYVE